MSARVRRHPRDVLHHPRHIGEHVCVDLLEYELRVSLGQLHQPGLMNVSFAERLNTNRRRASELLNCSLNR